MKTCIGSGKPHRTFFSLFARYYNAEEVIHKRISWNRENISKSGPKVGPKIMKNWILMKRCIGSAKPHVIDFRFFARYYDADGERISWNWEIISKSGPKARPIIMKIWILMKRCIGPQKPHRTFFHFYARYYDAGEVIHKRISWNWENISKSGPKFRWIIMKNWNLMKRCIGFGKPHRTFFPFSKDITMLKKWFLNPFPELGKISQNLGLHLAKNYEKLNIWWNGASDPRNITKRFFAFSQDITMLKTWFRSAFTEIEKISQNLGLKLGQKLWKIESLMKRCIGSAKPHIIDFAFSQDITMLMESAFPEIEKLSQNLGQKLGQ